MLFRSIADFGDFEQFVSDDPVAPDFFPLDPDELPWYNDEVLDDYFKKR